MQRVWEPVQRPEGYEGKDRPLMIISWMFLWDELIWKRRCQWWKHCSCGVVKNCTKCCLTRLTHLFCTPQPVTVDPPHTCQFPVKHKTKSVCIRAKDALCNSQWSEWSHFRSVPPSAAKWDAEPLFPLECGQVSPTFPPSACDLGLTLPTNGYGLGAGAALCPQTFFLRLQQRQFVMEWFENNRFKIKIKILE